MKAGDHSLVGKQQLWLQNPDYMDAVMGDSTFEIRKNMALRTAKGWKPWLHGALRTSLQPLKKAAKTIKTSSAY